MVLLLDMMTVCFKFDPFTTLFYFGCIRNGCLFPVRLLPMHEDQPLFANKPEWADVVPLEQYEGTTPIAPIFYTPECACIQ